MRKSNIESPVFDTGEQGQGAYVVFDDCLHASCLGAIQAVEEEYIQARQLHAEQTYPHLAYRPKGAVS